MQDDINIVIEKLKRTDNKKLCLKMAYDLLSEKYQGKRVQTYIKIFDLFIFDIDRLWAKNGFLHCTSMNQVLKFLLVKSELFSEKDLIMKWSLVWYLSPHQYLQVKINDEIKNIDIWGRAYGVEYGEYAHGFK